MVQVNTKGPPLWKNQCNVKCNESFSEIWAPFLDNLLQELTQLVTRGQLYRQWPRFLLCYLILDILMFKLDLMYHCLLLEYWGCCNYGYTNQRHVRMQSVLSIYTTKWQCLYPVCDEMNRLNQITSKICVPTDISEPLHHLLAEFAEVWELNRRKE